MPMLIIKKKILLFLQRFFAYFSYKVEKIDKQAQVPVWPKSNVSHIDDKFLMLLTPPNSGSTAMGGFICQSNKIAGLTAEYEYFFILKKLCGFQKCSPHTYINYRSLAGMLSTEVEALKQAYPEVEYVFEKYPDNTCRYRKILEIIPNTKVVASNRNPYAQVASSIKRKNIYRLHDDLEEYRMCTHYWLVCSEYIRDACEKDNVSLVTYEQFCDNPYTIISAFGLNKDEFRKDFHVSGVKDYAPQAIKNMNDEQIAPLSNLQKETITEALSEHKGLLAYFGYELMS